MKRAAILSLFLLATACPGLKRPPPGAEPTPTPAVSATPAPAPTATSVVPADEGPRLGGLALLETRVATAREEYAAFLARPDDRPRWEALIAQIQVAEEQGFALLDTSDDARVEELMLELGDLRAAVSEREP